MYRLNEQQTALVEEARQLADKQIAPHADAVDAQSRFPREAIEALAKSGFFGLTLPAEYGGKGQGLRVACAVLDEIAQRCASTAMIYLMHLSGCSCYVAAPQASEPVMRAAAAGKHLSTLAWSEKGSRSHFWAPVSQAAQNNGHVILNAQKSWVTSAGEADGYVVSTRTPGGTAPTDSMLYLVMKGDTGMQISGAWSALGMRGNASSPMSFENCAIPATRALSETGKGFNMMLEVVLPWFQLCNAAISVGLAEAAVRATTAHLTGKRFEHLNSALADLPNLRARLAQMRIETDRARAHLVSVIDAVEQPGPATMLFVLESKAAAAESAIRVTDIGMQACGGAAFSRHLSLERNFRDARAATVMAPTTGAKDSPQATLLPIHLLQQHGLIAGRDFTIRRFDVLVGKHGDHIGGELEALHSLQKGESAACVALDLNWERWQADGTADPRQIIVLATTQPFDHCNFTVLESFPQADEERWKRVLFMMRYDNPAYREMMDMEGLKAWLPGRTAGYANLTEAVQQQKFFEK